VVDVEHRDLDDAGIDEALGHLAGQLAARLDVDEAGLLVDQVAADEAADEILGRVVDLREALLLQLLQEPRVDLRPGLGQRLPGRRVDQVGGELLPLEAVRPERALPALAGAGEHDLAVEGAEDRLGVQA